MLLDHRGLPARRQSILGRLIAEERATLWTPGNRLRMVATSTNAPAGSSYGVAITPGNNTKGSWVTVIADTAVTEDIYGISVVILNGNTSATARDCILDVGTDPAGGTTFGVVIPDLLGSAADATAGQLSGHQYYFPLFIKAGSEIGMRASQNGVVTGTRAVVRIYGEPSNPELCRAGSYVDAIGTTAASSAGTALTPGTSAEGSWTAIGSVTAKDYWWTQFGFGINNGTIASLGYHADTAYGDDSNKHVMQENVYVSTNSNERAAKNDQTHDAYCQVKQGAQLYARMHCSGTPDTGISASIYMLGG